METTATQITPIKERRQLTFRLFGVQKSKTVSINDIKATVDHLQNSGITFHKGSGQKHGFWGLVCKELRIPNNANTRHRLNTAYRVAEKLETFQEEPLQPPVDTQKKSSFAGELPLPSDDSREKNNTEQSRQQLTISEKLPLSTHESLQSKDDNQPEEQSSFAGELPLSSDDSLEQDNTEQSRQQLTISEQFPPSTDKGLQSEDENQPEEQSSFASELPLSSDDSLEKDNTEQSRQQVGDGALDQDGFIHFKPPQEPSFFFISQSDWELIKNERSKRGFHGLQWTSIIAKGLKQIYPYCSLVFKRHRLKTIGSKCPSPEFWCVGYCQFKDCPITFTVTVNCAKELRAVVNFKGGESRHNIYELKTRPIRSMDRLKFAEKLGSTLPRTMYLKGLSSLSDDVMLSGCRDDAPSANVLKNISWEVKKSKRCHSNEIMSLDLMIRNKKHTADEVLQCVLMHPRGVMLWSQSGLQIYQDRCKEDIVYLDATGSIIKKQTQLPPYYVYELVVRNPQKQRPPFTVATFLTCDHTTASITFFLNCFQINVAKSFGHRKMQRPLMLICDGSMVLMQAICVAFAKKNLNDTINQYFNIACGDGTGEDFALPVLHRCLSHVMKNGKEMCRKYAPEHYHLAMHVFGLFTRAESLDSLDEMVRSATVVFTSPSSQENVKTHFKKLQRLLQKEGMPSDLIEDCKITPDDFKDTKGNNKFGRHYSRVIENAPLDMSGNPNPYYCPGLMEHMKKYVLPFAGLWSGIMLGDLGRHGSGPNYEHATKKFNVLRKLNRQNITVDHRTQGIMEKSQWDLKHIRFTSGRLTRLDDFVIHYQEMHPALLKEYGDINRTFLGKRFPVEVERWKERRHSKRGRYVTPLRKEFTFKEPDAKPKISRTEVAGASLVPVDVRPRRSISETEEKLLELWKRTDTEAVIAVIPSQIRGRSFNIRHSELRTLRPNQWLTGEIIEGLFQNAAKMYEVDKAIYILNYYTAGVILSGDRSRMSRQSLPKVDFSTYQAIVSFVNIDNVHWKLLFINSISQTVYLVDPAENKNEDLESDIAAKRFSEFLKMRRTRHGRTDWVAIKWRGGTLAHPVQQDSSSCGLIVTMMAKEIMKAFPQPPVLDFSVAKREIVNTRKAMAMELLEASVFDDANNCAMCSLSKSPGAGEPMTNWIQCDKCDRWYHENCLGCTTEQLQRLRETSWNCCLCI